MGRSHLYTMHQAKIIVAQGGARLGEKQYISIAHTSDGDAVALGQQLSWGLAVTAHHLLIFLYRQHLFCPLFILLTAQP